MSGKNSVSIYMLKKVPLLNVTMFTLIETVRYISETELDGR